MTLAYWSRDPKMIIADIAQVSPTYFPSVPRMFEKIYTLATSAVEDPDQLRQAVALGVKVRMMREAGQEVPRGAPGGLRPGRGEAVQERARPVRPEHPRVRDRRGADRARDPRVLLRLRRAGDGGLRDDRDVHERHGQPARGNGFRFGSVGKPMAGVEVKIADDGEVLIKGPNIFQGYYKNEERHRARRSRTAGCTPATSAGSTTTASSTSPAARRTSSSRPAARTSRPPTSRTGSSRTAGSRRPWWSATAART